jgi:hypothetical protein
MREPLTPLGAILLTIGLLIPVGDFVATVFFFRLWLRSRIPGNGRSWLLGLMTAAWATITVIYLLFGFLAVRRVLGFPPFESGAYITIGGLLVLGTFPITFMLYFQRRK